MDQERKFGGILDRVNKFGLEPGPYKDDQDFRVVLLDVVTHTWNAGHNLLEALSVPVVVVRNLITTNEHIRYSYPIDVFKIKFSRI